MHAREVVDRWMAVEQSKDLDRMAEYLRKGRRFRALGERQLRRIYIDAINAWAANIGPYISDEGRDAEFELKLRDLSLPDKETEIAWERIIESAASSLERMSKNEADAMFASAYAKREPLH